MPQRTLATVSEIANSSIEDAIVSTLTYADIFDYPLKADELHRYLIGHQTNRSTIEAAIEQLLIEKRIEKSGAYFSLFGRTAAISKRQQREERAADLWPQAVRYGRIMGRFPFVRMVAVTGSLAVNNADREADVDYLVVTANDRLWLCRMLIIGLVHWAERKNITLCPNYFIAERALKLPTENLYTARELAQMIPLTGLPVYHRLKAANGWMADYLPNATVMPKSPYIVNKPTPRKRSWVEWPLQTRLGGWLESWERERKIGRFRSEGGKNREANFGPDHCKGHFDAHQSRILTSFQDKT